jgi:hypothetical protein
VIPVNASPTIDVGLVPADLTPAPALVSFDEAKGNLKDSESLSLNPFLKSPRLLFIQGGNVDESGNAQRWVFGINKGDVNELRVYDHSGWTIIPWNATISSGEIDLNQVVSPDVIFKQIDIQILGTSRDPQQIQRDIELRNGTYTLTVNDGSSSQIMRFNAATGVAIE